MENEVLVKVESVGKKFCRDFKRSLWYGLSDLAREVVGLPPVQRLRKKEFWAVQDVSFELRRGECLGLIGHNGAGKSTLLKMLNGLIRPDTGNITMKGRVGALIELGSGFNPVLTGRENIYVNGQILGFSKKEIDEKFDAIVDFAEIGEFIDSPVQNYSSGMKVRLGFAVAAQMEPDVLIIDEVLAVGDYNFRAKCFNSIERLLKSSAVIFVTHSMPQISRIASTLIVLNNGEIFYEGKSLGDGVQRFYSLSKFETRSRIGGDESVKINSVLINNSHLETTIKHNSVFEVMIEFTVVGELNEVTIGLMVKSKEEINVLHSHSSYDTPPFRVKSGSNKIKYKINRLMLSPGPYTLSISVNDNLCKRIYAVVWDIAVFNVIGKWNSAAISLVKGEWELIK